MSRAGLFDRRADRRFAPGGVATTALVAGYPVTLTYFATATPFAMVSCLSLLLVFVLLAMRSRRLAFANAGVILWALLFTRPDMLPFAMIPAGWALLIEPKRKLECLAIASELSNFTNGAIEPACSRTSSLGGNVELLCAGALPDDGKVISDEREVC